MVQCLGCAGFQLVTHKNEAVVVSIFDQRTYELGKEAAQSYRGRSIIILKIGPQASKKNAENNKGIFKLSAIPYVFKRIVTSILQHLCSSIISPSQRAFVKRRFTTTNLLELTSQLTVLKKDTDNSVSLTLLDLLNFAMS